MISASPPEAAGVEPRDLGGEADRAGEADRVVGGLTAVLSTVLSDAWDPVLKRAAARRGRAEIVVDGVVVEEDELALIRAASSSRDGRRPVVVRAVLFVVVVVVDAAVLSETDKVGTAVVVLVASAMMARTNVVDTGGASWSEQCPTTRRPVASPNTLVCGHDNKIMNIWIQWGGDLMETIAKK